MKNTLLRWVPAVTVLCSVAVACDKSSEGGAPTNFITDAGAFTPVDASTIDAAAPTDAAAEAEVDAGPQVVSCATLDANFGSAVALQNATATFSQQSDGDFRISKAIDGTFADNLGWGINPQEATPQTAAFETTTSPSGSANGTRLLFVLKHAFSSAEHGLGRFRLSVTTADRASFADGNEGITTAGDVGAAGIWTVLTPRRLCATNDAALSVLGDSSVLAQDKDTAVLDYIVEADTTLAGITGVRLEVLNDASLPMNGPGLQNSNGNFVLSELIVRAAPR